MGNISKYPTITKMVVVNTLFLLLLSVAAMQGLILIPFIHDKTYVCILLAVLGAWGLIQSFWKAYELDKMLSNHNLIKLKNKNPHSLTAYFSSKILDLQHLSHATVFIGLIGTILGVIIALFGITPDMISNLDTMLVAVGTILSGDATSFFATFVGSFVALWLDYNISILNKNYTILFADIMGEN